jgi:hypothetical protein
MSFATTSFTDSFERQTRKLRNSGLSLYKSWRTPSFAECVYKLWSLASRNYICRCARLKSPRLSSLAEQLCAAEFTGAKVQIPAPGEARKSRHPNSRPANTFRVRALPFLCAHSPRADFFPLERRDTSHFTRARWRTDEKATRSGKFICMPAVWTRGGEREIGRGRIPSVSHAERALDTVQTTWQWWNETSKDYLRWCILLSL